MEDSTPPRARAVTVHLFGGPYVTEDQRIISIPPGSRRLVIFLALRRGRFERSFVAGTLWPDCADPRASNNLRGALFRLHRAGIFAIDADKWSIWLDERVRTDLDEINAWADVAIHCAPQRGGALPPLEPSFIDLPEEVYDLLHGHDDEWIEVERERVRQRALHALEALARRYIAQGRLAEAIDTITPAVVHEPLRESAQSVLVDAHLASGNLAQAVEVFESFTALLQDEVGVPPSREFTAKVRQALGRARHQGRAS